MNGVPDTLRCPHCRAPLRLESATVVCEQGHRAGAVDDDVFDFTGGKEGTEAELVAFWSSSGEYYAEARAANVDYADEEHAGHRRVLELLVEARVDDVLDVGCGTGEFAAALRRTLPSARYVGVDVSTLAPRLARELGRPGLFLAADGERLPFADAAFDAVVSLYALEHFAHPKQAIAEMVRVTRPRGTIALLSLAYDRPLGTVPSIRFGLPGRSRRDPLNLAFYAANRTRFALRQTWKQIRMFADSRYLPFELVERPIVLEGSYSADLDAVHVVSPRAVVRLARALGCDVLETSLPPGMRGWVRGPFDFRLIARKGQDPR